MVINEKLLDELLADYKTPEDMIGANGILKQAWERFASKALLRHRNRPRGASFWVGFR